MALPQGEVRLCDPHQREGKRAFADHFTVYIDGPDGPHCYEIDVCNTEEQGKTAHDRPLLDLRAFLAVSGTEIHGAELILPGDRKVITPREVFHQELPAGPFPRVDMPEIPAPVFSSDATPPKPEAKEEKEYPDTFYGLLQDWMADNDTKASDLAYKLGYASVGTVYRWRNYPPSAEKMQKILRNLGYSADEAHNLSLKYADIPEAVISDDPGGDAIRRAVYDEPAEEPKRKPTPPALQEGDRRAGLHTKAIVSGNGRLYGVNPRTGS